MNWVWLFFGFTERINRAKFWLATAIQVAAAFTIGAIAYFASAPGEQMRIVLGIVLVIPLAISALAVSVKRLHDRDKSGWWVLLFYSVPNVLDRLADGTEWPVSLLFLMASLAISIWAFIELGVLRGTAGPNRFGNDPLGNAATARVA